MDSKDAISKQVELLRNGYNILKYPNCVERMCVECDLENMKFADRNELGYANINFEHLGIPEPFHRASIIGFPTNKGPIWYLVDPTYGQFFENEKFKNYMFKNHKDFSDELLDKGFIECNLSNILNYINGFIFSNAFTSNINVEEVYNNIENLLVSNKIINNDLNNLHKRLIELLHLRKNILYTSKYSNELLKEQKSK